MFSISIKSKKCYSTTVQTINSWSDLACFYFLKNLKTRLKAHYAQPAVLKHHCIKWSTVKSYSFIAIVIAAMLFASCEKEKFSDPVLNSTISGNSLAQAETELPLPNREGSAGSRIPLSHINYGSYIGAPAWTNDVSFQVNVADQLGISCLRERVVVPLQSLNNNPVPELYTNYNIILNFCSPYSSITIIPFVSDIERYRDNLNTVLDKFTVMPALAVIENEESNRYYYSGTASQYIHQLSAAIDVMHERGIKVANGGITSTGLNYLVYKDFLEQGKEDSAQMFQKLTNVTPKNYFTQDRGDFVDELLTNYAKMDLDYVNFHWKGTSPNMDALKEVINYLKKRTKKPVISNELGQFDKDPDTLVALLQLCTDQKFPFIIWYSPDENAGKRDTPLHHDNGSLTPTGIAYQNFLED
jgi:hypothetical protein